MAPELLKDGSHMVKLKEIEDSQALGQALIDYELVTKLRIAEASGCCGEEKHQHAKKPELLEVDEDGTFDGGYYMRKHNPTSSALVYFSLLIAVCVALGLGLYKLWPIWLQLAVYNFFFFGIGGFFTFLITRVLCWVIGYHFGVNFWIMPNFKSALKDQNKVLSDIFRPFVFCHARKDQFAPVAMGVRALSASLMGFGAYYLSQNPETVATIKTSTVENYEYMYYGGLGAIGLTYESPQPGGAKKKKKKKKKKKPTQKPKTDDL